MEILKDPETYIIRPEDAWKRVKTRNASGRFLAIVRELARFREDYAQTRNVPRSRVYKDDALVELASTKPGSLNELGRSRLLLREARKGEIADGILAAVKAGLETPNDDVPKPDRSREKLQVNPALADLRAFTKFSEKKLPYDVVFVDPPYDSELLAPTLAALQPLLSPWHRIYAEHARGQTVVWPDGWEVLRSGQAGQVSYHLLAGS